MSRRVIAQIRKELTQFIRDRFALSLALLLPAAQLLLMGLSISFSVDNLPIVVQDLDSSSTSRQFIDSFRESLSVYVAPWPTDRQASEALTANAARAVLVIPQHFGRNVARGMQTPVQFLVDGTDANTARLLGGHAAQITSNFNGRYQRLGNRPAVEPEVRLWFNPGLSAKMFYGPGIFVLVLSMFPPLLATLAAAREGEQKTILQVYVANISAHEFLLGKIGAFMVVAIAESIPLFLLLLTVFGLGFAGDPTPLLIATLFYTFCVAAFGTLIGLVIPNQTAAMQAIQVGGFMLVMLLSGLMFPVNNIPDGIRWLSNFVWGRYYIEIVRDALLQGGGWPATWYKVLAIAGIGGAFYLLAWRNIHRMQVKA